jgi:hypothetical protein
LLKAVADVKMTAQVRFHLGLCEEQLGQLIEALNDFERAKIEAAEQRVATVAEEAPEHAARVRARVPKVVLVVPSNAIDAKVTIDDQPISPALTARPVPLNPGDHVIVVRAPGRIWSERVGLAEREEKRLQVVFSPAPAEPVAAAPAPALAADRGRTEGKIAARADLASRPSRTLGWVGVGVGGAALVGAGISVIVRAGALREIEDQCPTHENCPPSLRDSQSRARTFGALGIGLGVAGVAAAAVGIVFLTRPDPASKSAGSLSLGPWLAGTTAGAAGQLTW